MNDLMAVPKISVVVPCFNLGRYLNDAVDSVFAQSFQDFEILIVDDGSTDDETRRILADYRRPRTRVVRSANRGLPAAKNLGLKETSGAYVCMLDADDRLEPSMLGKSAAVLDERPEVTFVSHWLRTFGDEVWDWTPTRCDFPALLDTNTVNGAALVRRSALEAVGGFDESMRDGCEDWDLWIALVERGFAGHIIPEVLFHYRRRPDSMSRVMMRGDGHPRLYRRLAEKHPRAFRAHLGALLTRRDGDLVTLRQHVHDLALEQYSWLGPELAKARDDVATLERKQTRLARERAKETELADMRGAVEALLARERAKDDELAELRAAAEALRAEQDALRNEQQVLRRDLEQTRLAVDEERQAVERGRAALEEERTRRVDTEATLSRTAAELADVVRERDDRARAFDEARARALDLDASLNRARDEASALRRSLSWRLTAPLRALYRGIFGLGKLQ